MTEYKIITKKDNVHEEELMSNIYDSKTNAAYFQIPLHNGKSLEPIYLKVVKNHRKIMEKNKNIEKLVTEIIFKESAKELNKKRKSIHDDIFQEY